MDNTLMEWIATIFLLVGILCIFWGIIDRYRTNIEWVMAAGIALMILSLMLAGLNNMAVEKEKDAQTLAISEVFVET